MDHVHREKEHCLPGLTRFVVHVYAVIRRKFVDVDAVDQRAAIAQALDSPERANWFARYEDHNHPDADVTTGVDAEETTGYLVDVDGDEQFEQTHFYHSAASDYVALVQQLSAWRKSEARDMVALDKLITDAEEKTQHVF